MVYVGPCQEHLREIIGVTSILCLSMDQSPRDPAIERIGGSVGSLSSKGQTLSEEQEMRG